MKGKDYQLAMQLRGQGFTYPEIFRFLIKNAGLDYYAAINIIRMLEKDKSVKQE